MPTDTVHAVSSPGQRRARQREQRLCDPIGSMAKKVARRDKAPGNVAFDHGFDVLDVGFGVAPLLTNYSAKTKWSFS